MISDEIREQAESLLLVGFLSVKEIAERLHITEVEVWSIMDEMEIIDPDDRS